MTSKRILLRLSEEERRLLDSALDFFLTARNMLEGKLPAARPLEKILLSRLEECNPELGPILSEKLLWDKINGKDRSEFLENLSNLERNEFLADVDTSSEEN